MKGPVVIAMLAGILLPTVVAADAETNTASSSAAEPTVYCVLFHTPGPKWEPGTSFREQPGIEGHVRYMAAQLERGLLVMGGPFLDDSGGMMICRDPDLDRVRTIAEEDPGVKAGLLNVDVKRWLVPMSSLDADPDGE